MQTFLSSLMTYLTEADIALIREDLKFKRDASLRVNILRTTDSEALKSLSSIRRYRHFVWISLLV